MPAKRRKHTIDHITIDASDTVKTYTVQCVAAPPEHWRHGSTGDLATELVSCYTGTLRGAQRLIPTRKREPRRARPLAHGPQCWYWRCQVSGQLTDLGFPSADRLEHTGGLLLGHHLVAAPLGGIGVRAPHLQVSSVQQPPQHLQPPPDRSQEASQPLICQ